MKSKIKAFAHFIQDNILQIIELAVLLFVILSPFIFDLSKYFEAFLPDTIETVESAALRFTISRGNFVICIVLVVLYILSLRKFFNVEVVMNSKNTYHNQPYFWYWLSSKILGIKKCNLVRVPIYLQFKLVINSVFPEFPLNKDDYPITDKDTKREEGGPSVKYYNDSCEDNNEINLMLEDTYPLEISQLPDCKKDLPTVKISRSNSCNGERHYNDEFIEKTISTVRDLPDGIRVNVFATTNPLSTKQIASRVFALADRGNVSQLYVYQQDQHADRNFYPKEHKIY